jgi:pimeloyl-ACP methyl ester carboxylesterase
MLVHGFPLDGRMWEDQLAPLSRVRRLIVPDLRGHGQSADPTVGPSRRYSVELFASDLVALLEHLGLETVDLAGLSMGGYTAFAFLEENAARLRSLALIDTRPTPDTPDERERRSQWAEEVRRQGSRFVADAMLPKLLAPTASDLLKSRLYGIMNSLQPDTVIADLLGALRDRPDRSHLLPGISVPCLVLVGAQDAITPAEQARQWSAQIPGARLVVVDHAGHMSPMEQPVAVNRALVEFWG